MRALVLVLALTLALSMGFCGKALAQSPLDPNQKAFEEGMRAAARGQWPVAVVILADLADRTDQPRVRLELARVLYLSGDFRRSKTEFLKVYRRNLPYPVRRAINIYLDEIDQRIGYFQPQLSLVIDNNPGRTAESGTYDILGAPFDFQQPNQKKIGLAYRANAVRPLTMPDARKHQWVTTMSAEGQIFGDKSLDSGVYSLAVRLDNRVRNDRVSLGWRYHTQAASDAQGPYVEYYRRLSGPVNRQTVVQASLEGDRYADLQELNGVSATLAVDQARDIDMHTSGHAALGVSDSSLRDSRLPKASAFAVLGASRSFPKLNLNVVANLSLSQAWYGQRDPFFGKIRIDRTERFEVAFYGARPIIGLFPGVVASAEQRTSTIEFYGFRRVGISMDFRSRF